MQRSIKFRNILCYNVFCHVMFCTHELISDCLCIQPTNHQFVCVCVQPIHQHMSLSINYHPALPFPHTSMCVYFFKYLFNRLPLPEVPHFLEMNRELPPTPQPTSTYNTVELDYNQFGEYAIMKMK